MFTLQSLLMAYFKHVGSTKRTAKISGLNSVHQSIYQQARRLHFSEEGAPLYTLSAALQRKIKLLLVFPTRNSTTLEDIIWNLLYLNLD